MSNDVNDKQAMLVEYSKEIAPLVRKVILKAELLKDFKDSDSKAVELKDSIKALQDELKEYIKNSDDGKELTDNLKEAKKDLKLAIKACSRGTDRKPAELNAFFTARAKDNVKKAIKKGGLFAELNNVLEK